jgi:hypothetical protein
MPRIQKKAQNREDGEDAMSDRERNEEKRLGEATYAAIEASEAISRYLEKSRAVTTPEGPPPMGGQRMAEAAREAETAAELAASNIRNFLELQQQELASLIMSAASLEAAEEVE